MGGLFSFSFPFFTLSFLAGVGSDSDMPTCWATIGKDLIVEERKKGEDEEK